MRSLGALKGFVWPQGFKRFCEAPVGFVHTYTDFFSYRYRWCFRCKDYAGHKKFFFMKIIANIKFFAEN